MRSNPIDSRRALRDRSQRAGGERRRALRFRRQGGDGVFCRRRDGGFVGGGRRGFRGGGRLRGRGWRETKPSTRLCGWWSRAGRRRLRPITASRITPRQIDWTAADAVSTLRALADDDDDDLPNAYDRSPAVGVDLSGGARGGFFDPYPIFNVWDLQAIDGRAPARRCCARGDEHIWRFPSPRG